MAGILKCDQVQSDSNLSFQVAGANVAYMNSTGLQMTGGQIIAGSNTLLTASGLIYANAGIAFPVTQSNSSDPNTFDDYEEGTWTPVCSTTVSSSNGTYVKIGNIVLFSIQCSITSNASGASFTLSLPFASSSVNASRAAAWFGYTNGGSATPGNTTWLADAGTAQISAYITNGANRTNADFNAALYLSGQFRTD
jgi:hypothetical protein